MIDLCVSKSSVLCRSGNSWIAYTLHSLARVGSKGLKPM